MNPVKLTEEQKILDETMLILKELFFQKCSNSDFILENKGHQGFYYLPEKMGNRLKQQLIKYNLKTK